MKTFKSRLVKVSMYAVYLMAIMLSSLIFGGCIRASSNLGETHVVVDQFGRSVTLPRKIDKVYADWGQGKIQLMAMGVLDKAVCVDRDILADNFTWAKIIIPAINDVFVDDVPRGNSGNVEAILNYGPDVVFTYGYSKITKYEAAGIRVIGLNYSTIIEYTEALMIMGKVLGPDYEAKAIKYRQLFQNNLDLVQSRVRNIPNEQKKTVYYIAGNGLATGAANGLITMGGDNFESDWIRKAGAKSITESMTGASITITIEKLLQDNPDMIVIGTQFKLPVEATLTTNSFFANLDAVKNGQLHRTPEGIFGWSKMGPEHALQIIWGAKLFYPELFEDIDLVNLTQDFYKEFFNAEVSVEEVNKILASQNPPHGA